MPKPRSPGTIPEPKPGQTVVFRLDHRNKDERVYGVVLKINGKNTIYPDEKQIDDLDSFKYIVLPRTDVTHVHDGFEVQPNIVRANGKRAVLVIVFRQPGANIIDTVDRVRALLPQLRAEISPAINLEVINDRTTTIRASVKDVEFTLLLSIALVGRWMSVALLGEFLLVKRVSAWLTSGSQLGLGIAVPREIAHDRGAVEDAPRRFHGHNEGPPIPRRRQASEARCLPR